MLTQHKQTKLVESHQTNKNRNSTVYFYSKNCLSCSQRHNCDVYVGSKVRVSEFIRFLELLDRRSK